MRRLLILLGLLIGVVVEARKHAGKKLGPVDPTTGLDFIISLPLNNQAELNQFLKDLYDPSSPSFHQYLSSTEFDTKYGPTEDQITQLTKALGESSIRVTKVDVNRILVHAHGTVASLNTAFNFELAHFNDSGIIFYQPDTDDEPNSFKGIPITGVHGLRTRIKPRRHATKGRLVEKHLRRNLAQSPLGPSDIHTAYSLGSTYSGSGQSAALVEFDTYLSSDITTYANYYSIRLVPLTNVLITVGSNTAPTTPGSGQGEVTLDIEMLNAIAPGMTATYVYIAKNVPGTAPTLAVYSQIANDNSANVVSTSWGYEEVGFSQSDLAAQQTLFIKMATQGQSFFAAAGDSGAFDGGGTALRVDNPAVQPYVTGVGGTTLTLGAKSVYSSETTWYDSSDGDGGGGGVSADFSIPSYQSGVVSGLSGTSTSMRNVPDVSLNADPDTGYFVVMNGKGYQYGGTSAAAPLWAGFIALANQARIAQGLSVVGFANPALYALASSASYTSLFHDINDGSTNGYYHAVSGYDCATGLGTFKGDALITALVQYGVTPAPSKQPTHTQQPTPPTTYAPSKTPTTSPPSQHPSKAPTKRPTTSHPSKNPSTGPPSTSNPSASPTTPTEASSSQSGFGLSGGAPELVGIIVGAAVAVAGMAALGIVLYRRNKVQLPPPRPPKPTQFASGAPIGRYN